MIIPEKQFGENLPNWVVPPRPGDGILSGRFVRLEPLDHEIHAEALHQANSADQAIWDYLPYGPFETLAEYRSWVQGVTSSDDPRFFAVRVLETGRVAGVLSYLRITPEAGSIEVGHINFAAELQRTVAATEAVYLLMQWAFDAGYRRFEWKCNALNLGSRRAAQLFGFSYEGVFRHATVSKGRNRDTAWFACIDKEWPVLNAAYERWLDPANFGADGIQRQGLGTFTGPILVARDPVL